MAEYRYKLEECMTCPMLTTCLASGLPLVNLAEGANKIGSVWQRLCNACNRLVLIRTRVYWEYERHLIPKKLSCCPIVDSPDYKCPECHRAEVSAVIEESYLPGKSP